MRKLTSKKRVRGRRTQMKNVKVGKERRVNSDLNVKTTHQPREEEQKH